MLVIYFQIQNIFVETVIYSFLRWRNFWKIYGMNICWGMQFSDSWLEKSESQTVNIQIVKSFENDD